MKTKIIPAIDIIDGCCVRLSQGDYSKKINYNIDPVDVAKSYEDIGVDRLHIVDLDGAKASKPQNLNVLERISSLTSLDIQYGGGIKSLDSLKSVFESGAKYAICGTVAVTKHEEFLSWLEEFTGERIILGADVRGIKVSVNGWQEDSQISVFDLVEKYTNYGVKQLLCTDISKDGMLQGPSFELYQKLQNQFPNIDVIVSGGVSSISDIEKINDIGLRSAVVGKAIYEGHITLKDIERWLQKE